jgi:hypothetical protein
VEVHAVRPVDLVLDEVLTGPVLAMLTPRGPQPLKARVVEREHDNPPGAKALTHARIAPDQSGIACRTMLATTASNGPPRSGRLHRSAGTYRMPKVCSPSASTAKSNIA